MVSGWPLEMNMFHVMGTHLRFLKVSALAALAALALLRAENVTTHLFRPVAG